MIALNRPWRLGTRCLAWFKTARDKARRKRELLEQDRLRTRSRAERNALSLLLNLLNPEQRREFRDYGHFHARGGDTGERYRIRVDAYVNIDVLAEDGSVKYHLCARPGGDIPIFDVMAGQLLYLQDASAEKRFLQLANKHTSLLFGAARQ